MADDRNEHGLKNMVNWPAAVTGKFVRSPVSHSTFWSWLLGFWQSHFVIIHKPLDKIFIHQRLQYTKLQKCSLALSA
jgi:hypothetical protein